MKTLSLILVAFFALASGPSTFAGSKSPPAKPSPSPKQQAELDHAVSEFENAADQLGKALSHAADENTTQARKKMIEISSSVLKQLSDAMNQAAKEIHPRNEPSPSAGK
jgi:hypothetical protein